MENEKRLIDAHALIENLERYVNPMPGERGTGYLSGLATAMDEVEAAPRVDAVEVVHGRWKEYCDHFTKRQIGWICTNCSAVSDDLSNGDTPFCPHCGALMDLEDEDG